jgi:hypothetical protein
MNLTRVMVAFLVVVAALALMAHLSTTGLEYSRYNFEWTGTSAFFSLAERQGARDLSSYADLAGRNDTLLLVLVPGGPFSPDEIASVAAFLAGNNTVFIADETGEARELLAALGSTISVTPGNLSSVDREFRDPRSVIVHPDGEDPLTSNVTTVVLNRPGAVEGGETLLSTSLFSWMDDDGDEKIGAGEEFSSYGVLARERIGNGTLYVLSDPGVFANGMLRARLSGENTLFIDNVLGLCDTVLIDLSHSRTAGAGPVLALSNRLKTSMVFKMSVLIGSVLIIALAFYRRWGEENGNNTD